MLALQLALLAVFAVADAYAIVVVARRWHDDSYWVGYRRRLSPLLGEGVSGKWVCVAPTLIYGAPAIVFASALPVAKALGVDTDPDAPWSPAIVVMTVSLIAGFLGMFVLMTVVAILWRWGRPRSLVPPAFREGAN